MIRSILFDMGKVLLHFDRQVFLDRLDITPEDKNLLLREVFLSTEWVRMDRGTLDEPEAEKIMVSRLPEHLHPCVPELVSRWDQPLLPIEGMYQLVEELKNAGYGIYLLSNASHRQREYWPRLPASRFFDGTIISADLGVMKPHPDYYRHALQKWDLRPEECFFVDDVPGNIEGANFCGIPGAVFHGDAKLLRKQMRAAGIRVRE